MTLDYTNLASFLLLLKRDDEAGRYVRSLTLLDLPSSVKVGSDGSVDESTYASIAFEAARACSDVGHPSLQDVMGVRDLENITLSQSGKQEAYAFLDHVRRVILTSLPNLTTFAIKGDAFWSLDPQFQKDLVLPSLQNLKSVDFGPNRKTFSLKFSGKNALWMLLFLPSLRRASFSILLHKSDLTLFKSHSEAYAGKSSVKELFIDFYFNYNPDHEDKLNWEGDSKVLAVKKFLLATRNLTLAEVTISSKTSVIYKIPLKFGQMNKLWALEGLEDSYSTLRYLKIDGLEVLPEENKERRFDLSRFSTLEHLHCRIHLCITLAMSSRTSPFPSLQTLRFASVENGPFSMEELLAVVLRSSPQLFPGGLKKIVTPSSLLKHVDALMAIPSESWEAGMEELKKACEELNIELHLLNSADEASELKLKSVLFDSLQLVLAAGGAKMIENDQFETGMSSEPWAQASFP
jgi:hypothetical protein